MKAILQRNYKNANSRTVFVYTVKGSEADLAKYAEIQADNLRSDKDGNPLWFSTRCIGQTGKLIITDNNKIVADMSEYEQAASLAQQFGGNFGQELARAAAQKLVGGSGVSNDTPSTAPTVPDTSLED